MQYGVDNVGAGPHIKTLSCTRMNLIMCVYVIADLACVRACVCVCVCVCACVCAQGMYRNVRGMLYVCFTDHTIVKT
jgi:hypothetical protein